MYSIMHYFGERNFFLLAVYGENDTLLFCEYSQRRRTFRSFAIVEMYYTDVSFFISVIK